MAGAVARIPRPGQDPGPFKPHAIKVAEAARARALDGVPDKTDEEIAAARQAEIRQWKHDVCDLHRVLSVAQSMFLLLEHNNEALLRVAIEIVCDNSASAVLWWTEEWYSDEERRVYFREMVLGMLAKCLAYMNVEVEETDNTLTEEMEEKLRLALERATQLENARQALENKNKMIEGQVKDMEGQLSESQAREKEMKQANERLQNDLRELANVPKGPDEPDPLLMSKLAEMEAKLKAAEQEKALMNEKLLKAEESLKEAQGADASAKALADAKAAMADYEKKLKQEAEARAAAEKKAAEAAQQIAKLKSEAGQAPKPVREKKAGEPDHHLEEEVDQLTRSLEQEQQRSAGLATDNDRLNKELEKLRKEHEKLKSAGPVTITVEKEVRVIEHHEESAHHSMRRGGVTEIHTGDTPKAQVQQEVVHEKPQTGGVSQAEYDAKMAELDKALAKISSQQGQMQKLRDEKEALEARNDKMLKMLHQLKEQLRKVSEIAEKRGCGDLVGSILEEAGVTDALNSAEFTCFDRLYEDAKRRMEKHRLWDEERMGIRPGSPATRGRGMFGNSNWAPGGGQQFAMSAAPEGQKKNWPYGGGRPDRDDAPSAPPQQNWPYGGGRPDRDDAPAGNAAWGEPISRGSSGSFAGHPGGGGSVAGPSGGGGLPMFFAPQMAPQMWCPQCDSQMQAAGNWPPSAPREFPELQKTLPGKFLGEAGQDQEFYDSMRVVGFNAGGLPGDRPASGDRPTTVGSTRPGTVNSVGDTRPGTGFSDTRAGTPPGARPSPMSPAPLAQLEPSQKNRQMLKSSQSAMSLDGGSIHSTDSRSSPQNDPRLLGRKLIQSKSTGGLEAFDGMVDGNDSMRTSPDSGRRSNNPSSPVLANNIWAGNAHVQQDRQNGPGMFRGFKLVSLRGAQRKLPGLQGGPHERLAGVGDLYGSPGSSPVIRSGLSAGGDPGAGLSFFNQNQSPHGVTRSGSVASLGHHIER